MSHPAEDIKKAEELSSETKIPETRTNKYEVEEEPSPAREAVGEAIKRPLVWTSAKILLILLLLSSVIIFVTGFIRYTELSYEKEILQERIIEMEDDIEEAEYLLGVPLTDKDYILRIAREKLGLFLPEEIVYYSDLNE